MENVLMKKVAENPTMDAEMETRNTLNVEKVLNNLSENHYNYFLINLIVLVTSIVLWLINL